MQWRMNLGRQYCCTIGDLGMVREVEATWFGVVVVEEALMSWQSCNMPVCVSFRARQVDLVCFVLHSMIVRQIYKVSDGISIAARAFCPVL